MKRNKKLEKNLRSGVDHILAEIDGSKTEKFHLLTSGWESDIYAFDKVKNGHSEPLVMRYFATGQILDVAHREWTSVKALYQAGYPVPRLYGSAPSGLLAGRYFYLMERINGYPMWRKLKKASDYEAGLSQVATLMAHLHRINPEILDIHIPENNKEALRCMFQDWRQLIATGEPVAVGLDPVLTWFETRLDAIHEIPLAIVHFDLHPENVLVEANTGRKVVIDWTGVCINDPRLDVFWAALLVGHQASEQYFDLMMRSYANEVSYHFEDCAYFEALVSFRRIASLMLAANQGAESRGMLSDVAKNMTRQIPHLRSIYRRFINATDGMRIPLVEQFFAQFPG